MKQMELIKALIFFLIAINLLEKLKKLLNISLCLILTFNFGYAQVPQGVGYQGVATDANGIELVNQAISIRASVLSGSANGTIKIVGYY